MSGVLAQAAQNAAATTSTGEAVAFWILGPVAVLAALGMLAARKAVHSALLLAVTMISLAVLYIGQSAPFLGIVQVVVYTGAVMMLFLFVLMLVGVDSADSFVETIRGQRVASILVGIGFAVLLLAGLGGLSFDAVGLDAANSAAGGNVEGIAQLVFKRYVWAFEVTSALLITAAVAAMVLAHRERTEKRPSQRELSEARFRSGAHPGPLPPPGVYARHNAVDTPALLPDGSPSELSVPRVLTARGDTRQVTPFAGDVRAVLAPAVQGSRADVATITGREPIAGQVVDAHPEVSGTDAPGAHADDDSHPQGLTGEEHATGRETDDVATAAQRQRELEEMAQREQAVDRGKASDNGSAGNGGEAR